MIEYEVIAHPYAKALYEVVQDKNESVKWLAALEQLSWIVQQPKVAKLINDVTVDDSDKAVQINHLLDSDIANSEQFKNFLAILAAEKRLLVLPNIFKQYQKLVSAKNNQVDAIIYTAYAIVSEGQRAKIVSDLEQHYHFGLKPTFVTMPELIGGIKVVVNDEVLDLSIQGKLNQLYTAIMS